MKCIVANPIPAKAAKLRNPLPMVKPEKRCVPLGPGRIERDIKLNAGDSLRSRIKQVAEARASAHRRVPRVGRPDPRINKKTQPNNNGAGREKPAKAGAAGHKVSGGHRRAQVFGAAWASFRRRRTMTFFHRGSGKLSHRT